VVYGLPAYLWYFDEVRESPGLRCCQDGQAKHEVDLLLVVFKSDTSQDVPDWFRCSSTTDLGLNIYRQDVSRSTAELDQDQFIRVYGVVSPVPDHVLYSP
jgi:hypothetical protein